MKISYNWLKSYVDFDESPEALAGLLTECGLEVEGIERYETVKGSLKGVVVGRVLSCEKHPDADRLSLTVVDVGTNDMLPVVCGAPNVSAGQKVLVATVGTVLITSKGPLEIRKATIRGKISEGMICAEDELGVGTSHDGIMILPEDTPVGMDAASFFKLEEDSVLEIGLTPNRIDAASHIGVARDIVAALNHRNKDKTLKVNLPDVSGFSPDNHDVEVPVRIEDPRACNRYCGLTITGLKVDESPAWLKNRLMAIGQKPINNVVDVTNFVLHELGQPLHAFDIDKIDHRQVIVRMPEKGTKFISLDGIERELNGEDLMICNPDKPMCMAGILGGIDSGVTAATKGIFLESAYFNPRTIRRSSGYHGIKTDASFRFERGVDPQMTVTAIKRAALLIRELAGGSISSDITDAYPGKIVPEVVVCHYHSIARLAGKTIPAGEILAILKDLDFEILSANEQELKLSVPPYRVDVTREADVVEEILRIYGYNNIEIPQKLHSSIVLSPKPDKERLQNVISDLLVSKAFYEIMNNSLTRSSYYEADGLSGSGLVPILNPLSQDLNAMRQTLLFGGLETIAYNQNRKIQDMRLFEFGNIYFKQEAGPDASPAIDKYSERMMLGLFLTGNRYPESWSVAAAGVDFFDLKSATLNVIDRIGAGEFQWQVSCSDGLPFYDFCQSMALDGETYITLGKVSKDLLKRFDIKQEVYYADIEWGKLIKLGDGKKLQYREIGRFPEVRRDLALLIGRNITFGAIEELAFLTEKKILRKVALFDVYQDDEKLGPDKKSYAVSFILQDSEKTLTDAEIDRVMERLTREFSEKLGASIR